MKRLLLALLCLVLPLGASAADFDHRHAAWDALLKKHVAWNPAGTASRVDYAGFARDRAGLKAYLEALSAVPPQQYDAWSREQRLAFLINAYNAFTVGLILTKYPDVKSIKDLGSLFSSPWKQEFFTLLGRRRHLDDIEHGLIRAPGAFDEPRIHFAVVCASIGCPALRDEAFGAHRLDAQLEDSVVRFLSDRTRNRYNSASGALEVSMIFKWYREDFEHPPHRALKAWLARYADRLTETPVGRERVRRGQAPIEYLNYDWALNDAATQR